MISHGVTESAVERISPECLASVDAQVAIEPEVAPCELGISVARIATMVCPICGTARSDRRRLRIPALVPPKLLQALAWECIVAASAAQERAA
jgi:hypothetical protein